MVVVAKTGRERERAESNVVFGNSEIRGKSIHSVSSHQLEILK